MKIGNLRISIKKLTFLLLHENTIKYANLVCLRAVKEANLWLMLVTYSTPRKFYDEGFLLKRKAV